MVERDPGSENHQEMYRDTPLTKAEAWKLTLYKWRYTFEAIGFDPAQVQELMFLKWRYASNRLAS